MADKAEYLQSEYSDFALRENAPNGSQLEDRQNGGAEHSTPPSNSSGRQYLQTPQDMDGRGSRDEDEGFRGSGDEGMQEAEPVRVQGREGGLDGEAEEDHEVGDGGELAGAGANAAVTPGTTGRVSGLSLPVARVKRLVKAEGDVQYLTAEAGILITKATELFLEAVAAEANEGMAADSRSTLMYKDVASLVANSARLEFLADIVPRKVHPPTRAPSLGTLDIKRH